MTDDNPQAPLRIGLTGGIASGKSTVADMFAQLGVAVIDTDVIARQIVAPGQPALDEIAARFGEQMIDAAGNLDRGAMRKLVFADSSARAELEAITHPRIGAETIRQADAAGGDYQLIVVPLLTGSPLRGFVDRVLVVDCDEDTQIRRLLQRDTETVEQAQRIVAAQASREERLKIANDVIVNQGTLDETRTAVNRLHQIYLRLAAKRVRI
ncbi:MAG: dephospho-CoA kinase [Woeseiaceae bacterium]|nr:dephospho-CoA kinase [Woeseiaceae bacterium]